MCIVTKGKAMDFGDILNKWEKRKPSQNGKKAKNTVINTAGESQKQENPIDAWIHAYGIMDKDQDAREEEAGKLKRRPLLWKKRPDAKMDIHGLTQDEAWNALEQFFADARRQGLKKILVIHGKGIHSQGEAVLKRITRNFIERCPFAGESGQDKTGGSGATWVLLKQEK